MGFCQGLANFELKNTFAWVKFFADKVLWTITWSVHQYQTEPKQYLICDVIHTIFISAYDFDYDFDSRDSCKKK